MQRTLIRVLLSLAVLALGAGAAAAQPADVTGVEVESDYTIRDFRFASGETLPALRIHYLTLGEPRRDAAGRIVNAVLLLHGTGGSGRQFLRPQFAGELFGPGQLLDTRQWYVILPDGIGHGASSKPSDGLRMKFPRYDYADMVEAEHRLVSEHLGVARLRLILGTSMGCMHAFMWGEAWPDGAAALMPLACQPAPIVGRNRLWRDLLIDAIKRDPAWQGGDYRSEPKDGLTGAQTLLALAGSAPIQMQATLPTRDAVAAYIAGTLPKAVAELDANDLIYQVDASRTYDPSAGLERITALVMWINSADDFINPPELGVAEGMAPRLKRGTFVLIPASAATHGHGTHTWAAVWKDRLAELLKASEAP